MAKKSRTQKRLERAREQHERFMELPLVPIDSYADSDGVWHFSDGSNMPNGLYRNAEGGVIVYEGNPDRQLVMG